MNQILKSISAGLFLSLSLASDAATNQVVMTMTNGAVLTVPWVCGQGSLTSLTVSAWACVATSTSATDRVLVERVVTLPTGIPFKTENRLNFQLGINSQGHPFGRYQGGGFDPVIHEAIAESETVVGSQWNHLAIVCDRLNLKLYRNGQLVFSKIVDEIPCNGWFSSLSYPGAITIGAANADPSGTTTNLNSYWLGKIDEVVVWNGVLSDSDISMCMNRKPSGTEPNLVAYWSFDDGVALDSSTNGVNGAFYNCTNSVERIIFPATLDMQVSTNVVVAFRTVQDALYSVEVSTNLMETNWLPFGTTISGTGDDCVVVCTNSVAAAFYRVRSW